MSAENRPVDDAGSPRNDYDLPEHLPPVEPPSAGFIVQLFVVPAIIVAVIVGLYLLFSRMAAGEADWRQLVSDVRSENPHVRWSGAKQLAMLLTEAANAPAGTVEPGTESLTTNREIAQTLVEPFQTLSTKSTLADDEALQLEFLGKALGQLDVPDVVVPPLITAAEPGNEDEAKRTLRKTSLNSLAMIVGRTRQKGHLAALPKSFDEHLIAISQDADRLFRNQAAFVLGLSGSSAALERLQAMLDDPEELIRVNAAVGLARNDSKRGLTVLEQILRDSAEWKLDVPEGKTGDDVVALEGRRFEQASMLKNALQAVGDLAPQLSDTERERLLKEVRRIGESFPIIELRSSALKTADKLSKKG